jgi:hypothetical protein
MPVDVLQVFRLAAIDVAWEVEVVIVLRIADLRERHHLRVAVDFDLTGEDIHDAVDVLSAEAVLVTVLDEALRRVDHEDAFAGMGVLFVEHDDAGRNAGAVEEICR